MDAAVKNGLLIFWTVEMQLWKMVPLTMFQHENWDRNFIFTQCPHYRWNKGFQTRVLLSSNIKTIQTTLQNMVVQPEMGGGGPYSLVNFRGGGEKPSYEAFFWKHCLPLITIPQWTVVWLNKTGVTSTSVTTAVLESGHYLSQL